MIPLAMIDRHSHSRRFTLSIGEQEFSLLQEAASVVGGTVEEFILSVAADRARALLDEQRHVVVSSRAFESLTAELDEPAIAVPALQELFALPRLPEKSTRRTG